MSAPAGDRPRSRGHLGRAEIAISARDLTAEGSGARCAKLRGVNVDVLRGQITVISGAVGSGKSTLLRLLAGLDRPHAGTVWIGARPIGVAAGRPPWRFRRDQLVFLDVRKGPDRDGARMALIESALAADPELVFVDEPAPGLRTAELGRIHAALHALTTVARRTVVVASASPEVATWADRIIGLEHGSLVLDLEQPTPVEARATAAALTAR